MCSRFQGEAAVDGRPIEREGIMHARMCAIAILVLAGSATTAAADRPAEQIVRERCHRCHGLNGLSSKPEFPKLAGQDVDYLTRQMANFKTGVRHSERMQQRVADLTGGEMRALA